MAIPIDPSFSTIGKEWKIESPTATDGSAPMQADGNSVDADSESAKMAQNGLEYQSLVAIAKGRLDIITAAIGSGG